MAFKRLTVLTLALLAGCPARQTVETAPRSDQRPATASQQFSAGGVELEVRYVLFDKTPIGDILAAMPSGAVDDMSIDSTSDPAYALEVVVRSKSEGATLPAGLRLTTNVIGEQGVLKTKTWAPASGNASNVARAVFIGAKKISGGETAAVPAAAP